MAGKHGVDAIQGLLTVVKSGVVAILQDVQSDGFQPTDLWAPFDSEEFRTDLKAARDNITQVLPEILELDGGDMWDLGMFAIGIFKDIKEEAKPALQSARKAFAKKSAAPKK